MRNKLVIGFYTFRIHHMGGYADLDYNDELIGSVSYGDGFDATIEKMAHEHIRKLEFLRKRYKEKKPPVYAELRTVNGSFKITEIADHYDGNLGEVVVERKAEDGTYSRYLPACYVHQKDVADFIGTALGLEPKAISTILNLEVAS